MSIALVIVNLWVILISLLLDFFSHVMIGGGGRGGICLLKTWYDTSKRTTCLVPCLVLHRFHCTKSEHLLLHVWNKQVHNITLTTVNKKAHIISRKTSPRSKHFRGAGEQETAEERNSVSVVCPTPFFARAKHRISRSLVFLCSLTPRERLLRRQKKHWKYTRACHVRGLNYTQN